MAMAKLNGNANKPATNIWQVMNYQVPRGKCVNKTSVLSSCPCLRFMLNPLQAASSFACDGCGHHASFHNLRNPGEGDGSEGWVGGGHREERSLFNGSVSRKRSATTASASASAGGGRLENGRAMGGGGAAGGGGVGGGEDGDSGDEVQIVKRARN